MIITAIILGVLFLIFWLWEIIFVYHGIKWTKNNKVEENTEGITVIKPIKDVDFELEKNLESWLNQDYNGPIQFIFSFQDERDPAIEIAEKLKEKYPQKDILVIYNPIIKGLNGKSSNMKYGVEHSKYDILVFGDSDTRVLPTFINKMIELLKKPKVGVVSCAQVNKGGRNFWTRFFTYIQNCETVFHWSFLASLGAKVGANGAAFAIRKDVLDKIGGIESFGCSLLEDMLLGNLLTKNGYKVKVGPFIDCPVNNIPRDKVLNYMKRSTIGFRTLIKSEIPLFIFMLFWYWIIFIVALLMKDTILIYLSIVFILMRVIIGMLQRIITEKRITPVDIILPLFFDVFGTFFLIYSMHSSKVVWRDIEYNIKNNGSIEIIEK